MATVKLQNGKVVLKNGKVSCSCCEGPQECCMYPAQGLADGLYSASDLPDQIVFYWRKPGGPLIGTVIDKSGSQYETNVGTTNLRLRIESNPINPSVFFWQRQVSGPLFPSADSASSPCLIIYDVNSALRNFAIEDLFADSYVANVGDDGSAIVFRTGIGIWEGLLGCGKPVQLVYFGCLQSGSPPGINTAPRWQLTWNFCNPPPGGTPGTTIPKSGSQNSPVGSYGATASVS